MNPLRHILLLVDTTSDMDAPVAWAVHLAQAEQARLTLLHVMTTSEADAWSPLRWSPEQQVLRQDPEDVVRDLVMARLERFNTEGLVVEVDTLRSSTVVAGVAAYAERTGVDLVMIGMHARRRGLGRLLQTTLTESLLRTAPCPVFVVPERASPPEVRPIRRILVPIDFTVTGEPAFHAAEAWALRHDAHLTVLHVVEGVAPAEFFGAEYAPVPSMTLDMITQARKALEKRVAQAQAGGLPVVEQRMDEGDPAPSIIETTREAEADLLVLGTHGRAGLDRFLLGSVAEDVLRRVTCPVLVVRSGPPPPVN